jgi:hypothetical protein
MKTGVSQKYTWAITTASSEGVGLGSLKKAFRTLQENLDPYGQRWK